MKKILFIHHAIGIGGAPINMINIIKKLDKRKYKALVLLIKDSVVRDLLIKEHIDYIILDNWFYKNFYHYFYHIVPIYIKWYEFRKLFTLTFNWLLSRYYFSFKVLKEIDYDIVLKIQFQNII